MHKNVKTTGKCKKSRNKNACTRMYESNFVFDKPWAEVLKKKIRQMLQIHSLRVTLIRRWPQLFIVSNEEKNIIEKKSCAIKNFNLRIVYDNIIYKFTDINLDIRLKSNKIIFIK